MSHSWPPGQAALQDPPQPSLAPPQSAAPPLPTHEGMQHSLVLGLHSWPPVQAAVQVPPQPLLAPPQRASPPVPTQDGTQQ